MRRTFVSILVVAIGVLVPIGALAGNQEKAEQIAAALKQSGQLHGYNVNVKFQDGTVWLKGEVATQEQMQGAMQVVFASPGVTRVVNQLTVASDDKANSAAPQKADRLATSFAATSEPQVKTTALQEPTPAPFRSEVPPAPTPVAPKTARPMPLPYAQSPLPMGAANGRPTMAPQGAPMAAGPAVPHYDQPNMPAYAWPSYAAYPNYAAVTYPKQYSPTAWPYIGPFYPYPQVPARVEEGDAGMARRLVESRLR